MRAGGVDELAIEVFTHHYRALEQGATGMIPEDSISPLQMPALADVVVEPAAAQTALAATAVIKLNGGLGTSMGMEQAKSLLPVRDGLSFLDIIVGQILHLRRAHQVRLPLILMNSFRTSADTLAALEAYPDLPVEGLPLEFLQNREPKLLADTLEPVSWLADPTLEWCPPGHGDIYTALASTGVLDQLLRAGYERVFISNSDNLGAIPTPQVAGWFAASGAPFAIEAVRRTASDRKGGHFAIRKADGRIVLRETAQTLPQDQASLADLSRHQFTSTNNLWIDLAALRRELDRHNQVLALPLIRNVKTVDPTDATSPQVIQIETAMGAAIELFEGAQTIEVGRDRFVPVKSTNDLLVLRSDVYRLGPGQVLEQVADRVPFVELGPAYKLVADFDERFSQGAPSLRQAESLVVEGDWSFGADVEVVGAVQVGPGSGHIDAGRVLTGSAAELSG